MLERSGASAAGAGRSGAPRRGMFPTVMLWREGRVAALGRAWRGAAELEVVLSDGRTVRALSYPELVGGAQVGDRVLLSVAALERGLGTGGFALVVALPDRLPADPGHLGVGHLVKARYTPTQAMVLGVDEQESEHHALLADADSIDGTPVVVVDLHSALPAVVAGIRGVRPHARVAYVMTDGGALPAAFSRTAAGLSEAGWLVSTISVGQAFGGDLEAVTIHTGLLAAHLVVEADVVVVSQGPGNLGTGTRWGFSGVAAGEAVNAVAALGGRPVAALRVSQSDPRQRHHGVSHHSLTAYGRVALRPADVIVPVLDGSFGAMLRAQADVLSPPHRIVEVPTTGLRRALDASPVPLSSMGRTIEDDATPFLAAAAAGAHAASLLDEPRSGHHR